MASTLQGVSGFLMKKTKGDEWGVYYLNDARIPSPYLMMSFTDVEEAVTVGHSIAKMFKKKCKIDRSQI